MEKVSVVMPAYNAERFIDQSIKSVISQTYKNIELVIVNDGSTDSTADIIRQYAEAHPNIIKFIDKPLNEGTAKTISRAMREASGDYMCWLSADDMYFEDMIESQLSYLISHPEYDACFSRSVVIDENNKLLETDYITDEYAERFLSDRHLVYCQLLLFGNAFHGCSLLGKRENFNKTGDFNPQYRYAHDYDFWLRFAALSNIGFVNQHNVMGRSHDKQVSRQGHNEVDAIKVFSDFANNKSLFLKLMNRAGLDPSQYTENVQECFNRRLSMFSSQKEELLTVLTEYRKFAENNM